MISLILTVLSAPSSTYDNLQQESPIVWQRLDSTIVQGVKHWEVAKTLVSPCAGLDGDARELCDNYYHKEITDKFYSGWCKPHNDHETTGRQLAFLAGMAVEYCCSNLIVAGWHYFNKGESINDQIKYMENKVEIVETEQKAERIMEYAKKDWYRTLASRVDNNTEYIHELAKKTPHDLWVSLFLQSEIAKNSDTLENIVRAWKAGFVTWDLGVFTAGKELLTIDSESSSARSCRTLDGKMTGIRLIFTTRIIDRKSFILEADPFEIYTNLTGRPCLIGLDWICDFIWILDT